MPEVAFVTRVLTHYRVPFHQALRAKLAQAGIRYRLLYGQPRAEEGSKADTATIDWAEPVQNTYLGPRGRLVWQGIVGRVRYADLVVIGQENALLSNYVLQLWRRVGGPRLAFFGHGRNFQAADPMDLAERFKRLWAGKVDWWFAYTERSAAIVAAAGFPRERISVVNNAIDTSMIVAEIGALDPARQFNLREQMFEGSQHVGAFVGGLYAEKRLDFLLDAARLIRAELPDFHLLIIGGGPDAGLVESAAREMPWLHYVGPKFGAEKTALMSLVRVLLMPGLVGLGILDSFAYGAPMVTTDVPYHSPEIEYLRDGENGVIVGQTDDIAAYAQAVIRVLHDDELFGALRRGGAAALAGHSIDAMAQRFADGIYRALNSPDPDRSPRA